MKREEENEERERIMTFQPGWGGKNQILVVPVSEP